MSPLRSNLQRRLRRCSGGQSTMEYATLVGAIALAAAAMIPYARRAMNANIVNLEDELKPAELELAIPPSAPEDEPVTYERGQPDPLPALRDPFAFVDGPD